MNIHRKIVSASAREKDREYSRAYRLRMKQRRLNANVHVPQLRHEMGISDPPTKVTAPQSSTEEGNENETETEALPTSKERHRKRQCEYDIRRHKQGMVKSLFEIGRKTLQSGLLPGKDIQGDRMHSAYNRHYIAPMDKQCEFCEALFWHEERTRLANKVDQFRPCCNYGSVILPPIPEPWRKLKHVLTSTAKDCEEFRRRIRSYNSAMSFASFGANINHDLANQSKGVYTFKIQGQVYHRIGDLFPAENERPNFSQIYLYDSAVQLQRRQELFSDENSLNPTILKDMQRYIIANNPFAKKFKSIGQVAKSMPRDAIGLIKMKIIDDASNDSRRYNSPTVPEISIIMPGSGDDQNVQNRCIVLHGLSENKKLGYINETHESYDPLTYTLMFPNGQNGWSPKLKLHGGENSALQATMDTADQDANHEEEIDNNAMDMEEQLPLVSTPAARQRGVEKTTVSRTNLTATMYYSNQLQLRPNKSGWRLFGRLLHQYMVDMYAKIEQNRLNYIRYNQKKLRAEVYQGIVDAVTRNEGAANRGTRIVLPSTFAGSARDMVQRFQSAMAIVRVFGKPDLFVTVTCNPNWPEIQQHLPPYRSANDCPDIIARVFNMKLNAILYDILKNHVLDNEHKLHTTDDFDKIVVAEIPDKYSHPELYETVTKHMLHGPCGPCIKNGSCSKNFPKCWQEATEYNEDGYPRYRRRNNGSSFQNSQGVSFDNRDVVPYNPFLASKYNAHINVEICCSVKAVKYLYKYVFKGHDRAVLELQRDENGSNEAEAKIIDEIQQYIDGRYISPIDACWRIYGFSLHDISPSVVPLAVHLENQQMCVYDEKAKGPELLRALKETTLTAWFKANTQYDDAKNYLYANFPSAYAWNKGLRKWTRKKVKQKNETIGRLYFVQPNEGERYYLRMLLHHVPGATSYNDLRTVDGVLCGTFKEACELRGLLFNDSEWRLCLQEAAMHQSPYQLRVLFVTLLLFCSINSTTDMWNEFKDSLSEDVKDYDLALSAIENIMNEHNASLSDFGLPLPKFNAVKRQSLFEREMIQLEVNSQTNDKCASSNESMLNDEQRMVYDEICKAINEPARVQSRAFFLHGAGGTGKTHVYNTLLARVRSKNGIAIALASTGIAAQLLDGGRTAHSGLSIPVELTETSTCHIPLNSERAEVIFHSKMIILDEAVMMHKHAIEAVDRTLRDIMSSFNHETANKLFENVPFGGKVIVFGGDFRQTLPITPHGGKELIVGTSILKSHLWNSIKVLHLKQNMRVRSVTNDSIREKQTIFCDFLLSVGEGKKECPISNSMEYKEFIELPQEMLSTAKTMNEFLQTIYGDVSTNASSAEYFGQRSILTPLNVNVDLINKNVTDLMPGDEFTYYSADQVDPTDPNPNLYTLEFLNRYDDSGHLPPHELKLKIGMPIILLRNLNIAKGLCNGTRMMIRAPGKYCLQVQIIGGKHNGERHFIPRIALNAKPESGIPLRRLQFPVRAAFALTINKSQGQTIPITGVYLPDPVFSHGQLYVALSRVSSPENIKVFITHSGPPNQTRNVVYRESLLQSSLVQS